MTSARATRESIATVIRAAVPAPWTVYAAPPTTPVTPSVVIGPRDPYRRRVTFTGDALSLRVTALVQQDAGADALDVIDDITDILVPALTAVDGLSVENVAAVGEQSLGAARYVGGVIDITTT